MMDALDLPMHFARKALALHNEQRDVEALRLIDHALGLEPRLTFALYLKGIIALALGDWETGLPLFELRHQCHGTQASVSKYRARVPWDGKPILGRVLIWCEQGYGDIIQLMRLLSYAAKRCTTLIFEVPEELFSLAHQVSPENCEVFVCGAELPRFDRHASIVSLPYLLGLRPDVIPRAPYLSVDPVENAYGLKVGLCWSRNTQTPTRAARNMSKKDVGPLLDWFDFLSLQEENNTWRDFLDTARCLAGLDLVISVDSALIHLAGAMGINAWMLLSVNCDHRWEQKRLDTPWYPTVRLFRQREPGDWRPVIYEVAQQLSQLGYGRPLSGAAA